jgi:5-methylthioadenosine/S-adenosylhomocysteine deaminase
VSDSRLLVRDAWLVPTGPGAPAPFRGWLRTRGNRIACLGPGTPPDEHADRVIDGRDRVVIPGLINAHAHSHSSLTRGSAEGLPLEDWLRVIEAEQRQLTEEQAYQAALATYCEMLQGGTTTVVDMCLFPRAALRAARETGIRATVVPYVADAKPFTPPLEAAEGLREELPTDDGRVRLWVGLHDLESCSDAQVAAAARLAERLGVGLHLHCAETAAAVERTLLRTGRRPVAQLAHLGALGPRTLLAHCVWVDADDRRLLAAAGSGVVHCPQANLKLGSGIAPVPELLAAAVPVALGSDGAKANNGLDLFETMKFASLLQKGVRRDPAVLTPAAVLGMATHSGAALLGIDAGRLAPGRLADLTLVRLDRFHLQPAAPETLATNLVHAARGADVDLVLVDGEIVVEGGAACRVDAAAIRARAAAIGASFLGLPR